MQEQRKYLQQTLPNGCVVIKPILKKKFSQVYKNRTREIVRFILDTKPEDYVNLKWFTNDEARIDEIFQENRTILKHLKLHLSDLEPIDSQHFSNELATAAELNETSLEQSLIDIAALTDERGLKIAAQGVKLIIPSASASSKNGDILIISSTITCVAFITYLLNFSLNVLKIVI